MNGGINRSFPKNEWFMLVPSVQKPIYLWCANERDLADVSAVVPSGAKALWAGG